MIAATMMVRNEADMIPITIGHLQAQGVDMIFVADHGSTDGTREILDGMQGVVWYPNPEPTYRQVAWMAKLGYAAHHRGASWILPVDADEMWLPVAPKTSLRETLNTLPSAVQVMHATLWHHRDWDHKYAVPEGLPKVAYRWAPDARLLIGNHGVEFDNPAVLGPSFSLEIRHLQYRSAEHFIAKVRDHNSTLTPQMRERGEGAHKSQYEGLTDEQLLEVYAEMCAQPTVFDPIPVAR